MKVIAFNGSPRKEWNTATLLKSALDGAASRGADVELVHLYDLDYKGCNSCFACKLKGGKSYGHCGMRDGLTPLLRKVEAADGVLLGSPVLPGLCHRRDALADRTPGLSFLYVHGPSSVPFSRQGACGDHLYLRRAARNGGAARLGPAACPRPALLSSGSSGRWRP